MTSSGRTVLITGASSGIGLASANRLIDRGWRVFAAAWRFEMMEPLRQRGAEILPLDLASESSRRNLADVIASRVGGLDALVNNAGFGNVGPVETMALDQVRAMFEVNLFGLIGLTQLLLPPMREKRHGRIVNVSSIAGKFVTPGAGWYGASKHALEGISDALRLELHRFGVQVVLIEPGLIRTGFETVADESMQKQCADPVWGSMMRRVSSSWAEGFRKGSSPDVVARTISKVLEVDQPKARYRCGSESDAVLVHRFMPTKLWDAFVRQRMMD